MRSDELVTSRAQREWRTWKDRLDCAIHQAAAKENAAEPPEHLPKGDIASMLGDTVGAVSCDAHGGMAAGVSRSVNSSFSKKSLMVKALSVVVSYSNIPGELER